MNIPCTDHSRYVNHVILLNIMRYHELYYHLTNIICDLDNLDNLCCINPEFWIIALVIIFIYFVYIIYSEMIQECSFFGIKKTWTMDLEDARAHTTKTG